MRPASPPGFAPAAAVIRGLTRVSLAICGVLTALSLAGISADVVMRYGFASPIPHMHELTIIAFTFVYLLGAGALYARNDDIVIEFFFHKIPEGAGRVLILAIYIATAAVMAVILWQTIALMQRQMTIPTPSLRLPKAIFALPLALASGFIMLSSLVEAWACIVWILTGERPRVWSARDMEFETEI